MGALDNVTATGAAAKKMKGHGRHGDTEMAHVTPGEIVVPLSAQSPEVVGAIEAELNAHGQPLERYKVRSSKNSKNPQTGKGEYFLESVAAAVGGEVLGSVLGGGDGGGGGAAAGGVPYPTEANPLTQPVKALTEGAAPMGGLTETAPMVSTMQGSAAPVEATPAPAELISALQMTTAMGGVKPVNPINPLTGKAEYFDESPMSASKNPETGLQEYYGWTSNAGNVNDWYIENRNNLSADQQKQVESVLNTITVTPGQGARSNALANNSALNTQIANQLRSQGYQVGTGGNTYVAPATAPNAPAPANANQSAAYIDPNGGAAAGGGAAATATPSQETIASIWTPTGFHGGKTRVMTASGKVFEVNQNPHTNELSYDAVDGLDGYVQGTPKQNHNPYQGTVSYGNNLTGYNYVKPGGSFSYTDPSAPAASSETASVGTPNGTYSGNSSDTSHITPTYSNTNTKDSDRGRDSFGFRDPNDQRSQLDSWQKSIEDRLTSLNSSSDNDTDTTETPAESSTTGNSLGNVSSLSPDRTDRFRPRS
jgi:hypothetical protein